MKNITFDGSASMYTASPIVSTINARIIVPPKTVTLHIGAGLGGIIAMIIVGINTPGTVASRVHTPSAILPPRPSERYPPTSADKTHTTNEIDPVCITGSLTSSSMCGLDWSDMCVVCG